MLLRQINHHQLPQRADTFKFEHECRSDGILVRVKSEVPYTGVLYGLYDYFTCRVEPDELEKFDKFFPFPSVSNDCADSMRHDGKVRRGMEGADRRRSQIQVSPAQHLATV